MRIKFKYHNHEGKNEERDVDVVALGFDPSFHPEHGHQPSWFICGWDYSRGRDGGQYRNFSLANIILDDPKQFVKLLQLPREKEEDRR